MSQISLKSISGITSITTPAGVDDVFSIHKNDTSEVFRIDQSGNQNILGIITASQFKGDGSQLTGIDATKIITGNTQVQTIDNGSDGHVKVTTEGSEKVRITSSGRIGINTTNPQALLEIQDRSVGTLIGLSVGTQYGNASFGGYNNYPAIMNNIGVPLLYCDTNNDRTILFGDAVGFGTTCAIRVNNAERLRIDSNGNARLGPGGNNTNSTNYTTLTISNTAGGVVEFLDSGNNNIAGDIIGAEGSGMYISSKQDTPIIFRTGASNSEKVRIDSSGNLMIGMTNGSKKFSVKEASTSSGVYYNQLIGGSSHLAGYAVGIGFDPEGYPARTKIGIVAEGVGAGYSKGKLHFLLDNAVDSGEATLSEARMTINDTGQITTPFQPTFYATANSGGTVSMTSTHTLTNWRLSTSGRTYDVGSNFNTSNGRFTAPITGKYLFTGSILLAGYDQANSIHVMWRKNGSTFQYWYNTRTSDIDRSGYGGYLAQGSTTTMSLDANDYVDVACNFGGSLSLWCGDANWGHWSGHFLG